MKPTRFLIVAIVLLGMVATASAITQAGTDITNQAFGNYKDANGNNMAQVQSLVVTTTVSQVAGVSLGTDLTSPITAMDSTTYSFTLTNAGNDEDTFSLGATGAANDGGTYNFYLYHDADGSGTINGTEGDTEITSTGLVAFEGTYDLLVKVVDVTSGGGNPGEAHVVTLTATSAFQGDTTAVITLTSTVQAATVTGETTITDNPTPAPGESITYESCFTNTGTETAYNPVFTATMPSNTTLDVTSVKINGGSAVTLVQTALAPTPSDLPYHYNTATRTLTLELSDLGTNTGVDDEVCIEFAAVVDAPLAAGAAIDFPAGSPALTYENGGGEEYPPTYPTEDPGTFPSGGVEVDQTFAVSVDNGGVNATVNTGDPSDTLMVDFTVTNDGNGTDNFTFSDTSDYVTWVYYEDTDQDGVLSAAEKAAGPITETGDLTSGQVGYYIAIGTIPAGTADTAADASEIVATSVGDSNVSDLATNSTTCTAPVLTLVKSVLPAGNQPPGTELTYTIVVANGGTGVATTVVVTDAIPANTTYVAESMTVDGSADDDDDVVTLPETEDHAFKAASSVLFDFDTMSANGGATDEHTLTFKVTID